MAACGATGDDVCCLLDDDGVRTCLANKATDAKQQQDWPKRYDLLNAVAKMPKRPTANFWKELAQAAENTGHFREALSAAEQCQREANDPAMARECADIGQRIQQSRFGGITIEVPEPVPDMLIVVDGKRIDSNHWPITVPVLPGNVQVTALAPACTGYSEVVTVEAGKRRVVAIRLEPVGSGGDAKPGRLVLDIGYYFFSYMRLGGGVRTAPNENAEAGSACARASANCSVTSSSHGTYLSPGIGGLHLLVGAQATESLGVNGLVLGSPLFLWTPGETADKDGGLFAIGPGITYGNARKSPSTVSYGLGMNLMAGAAWGTEVLTSKNDGSLYTVYYPGATQNELSGNWKTRRSSGAAAGGTMSLHLGYRPWAGFGLRTSVTVLFGADHAFVVYFPIGIGFGTL